MHRTAPIIALASALLLTSCVTFESTAKARLEEDGCTDVTLSRTGPQSFTFDAQCGGQACAGDVTMGSGNYTSNRLCFPAPPNAPEGPPAGKVILGLGNTTGLCAPGVVEAALRGSLPRFKACYDENLKTHPDLGGTITYAWTIGADGAADVGRIDSEFSLIRCGEGVLASIRWPTPAQGVCRASWAVGVYQEAFPKDLGHGLSPPSAACPEPPSMEPESGQTAMHPRDLTKSLGGEWELESLNLWATESGRTYLQARADHFAAPIQGQTGPVAGRQTLMCHTQKPQFTTTTTTDASGNQVKTTKLASDDSVVSTASMGSPSGFSLDTDRADAKRNFQVALRNGTFVPTLFDTPFSAGTAFSDLFNLDPDSKDQTSAVQAIQRSADRLDLLLHFTTGELGIVAQAVYTRKAPPR